MRDAHVHTHTQEYYSVFEKNEILLFATTWVNLEGIMLTEISQRKTNNDIYMWNFKEVKLMETKSKNVVTRGWRVWEIGKGRRVNKVKIVKFNLPDRPLKLMSLSFQLKLKKLFIRD